LANTLKGNSNSMKDQKIEQSRSLPLSLSLSLYLSLCACLSLFVIRIASTTCCGELHIYFSTNSAASVVQFMTVQQTSSCTFPDPHSRQDTSMKNTAFHPTPIFPHFKLAKHVGIASSNASGRSTHMHTAHSSKCRIAAFFLGVRMTLQQCLRPRSSHPCSHLYM
jgi:hypothetical protein